MSELEFAPLPTDPRFINRTGHTYGHLTILGYAGRNRDPLWHARCSCGNLTVVYGNNLSRGHTTSCGCQSSRVSICKRVTTHGRSKTAEYKIFKGAKKRCQNPNEPMYVYYGGRGIEFRYTSFEEFLVDLGPRPSKQHSVDRIDCNSHYMPGNCRWATKVEQMNNTRSNKLLTFAGETKTLSQWANQNARLVSAISARLCRGWSVEDALTRPFRKSSHRVNQ